jgi:hypothetical protein
MISKYAADKITFIRGTFSIKTKKMLPASISFLIKKQPIDEKFILQSSPTLK